MRSLWRRVQGHPWGDWGHLCCQGGKPGALIVHLGQPKSSEVSSFLAGLHPRGVHLSLDRLSLSCSLSIVSIVIIHSIMRFVLA